MGSAKRKKKNLQPLFDLRFDKAKQKHIINNPETNIHFVIVSQLSINYYVHFIRLMYVLFKYSTNIVSYYFLKTPDAVVFKVNIVYFG